MVRSNVRKGMFKTFTGLMNLTMATAIIGLLAIPIAILPLVYLRRTALLKEERPPWRMNIDLAVEKSLDLPSLPERIESLHEKNPALRVNVSNGLDSKEIMGNLVEGKTGLAAVVVWDDLLARDEATTFPLPWEGVGLSYGKGGT